MAKRKKADTVVTESEVKVTNQSCDEVPVLTEQDVVVPEACACTGISEAGRDFPVYEEKPLRIAQVPEDSVTVEDMSSACSKRPKVTRLEKHSRDMFVEEPSTESTEISSDCSHEEFSCEEGSETGVDCGNESESLESSSQEEPLRIAAPMSEDQKHALESDEWFSRTRGCTFKGVKSPKPESKRPRLQDKMTMFSDVPVSAKECEVVSEDSSDQSGTEDADADYRLIHAHDLADSPDENEFEPLDSGDLRSPDEETPGSDDFMHDTDLFMPIDPGTVWSDDASSDGDGMELVCLGFEGVPFISKAHKSQCLCRNKNKEGCIEICSGVRRASRREDSDLVTEMPMYEFDGTVLGFAFKPYTSPDCDSELLDMIVYTNRGVYSMYVPESCRWRVNADERISMMFCNDKFEWVLNNVPVANIEFYPVEEMDGYHELGYDLDGVDIPCMGMLRLGECLYGNDLSIPVPFLRYVEIIDHVFKAEEFDPSKLNFLTAYFRRM